MEVKGDRQARGALCLAIIPSALGSLDHNTLHRVNRATVPDYESLCGCRYRCQGRLESLSLAHSHNSRMIVITIPMLGSCSCAVRPRRIDCNERDISRTIPYREIGPSCTPSPRYSSTRMASRLWSMTGGHLLIRSLYTCANPARASCRYR